MFDQIFGKLFSYEDSSDEGMVQFGPLDKDETQVYNFYDCVLRQEFGEFSVGAEISQIDFHLHHAKLEFFENIPMEFELNGNVYSNYLKDEVPEEAVACLWECKLIGEFFLDFDFNVLVELKEE